MELFVGRLAGDPRLCLCTRLLRCQYQSWAQKAGRLARLSFEQGMSLLWEGVPSSSNGVLR